MKSIENNIIKTMASKDYDRIISTINSYKEFEQTKDIMRYLKLTRNKYLGKKTFKLYINWQINIIIMYFYLLN